MMPQGDNPTYSVRQSMTQSKHRSIQASHLVPLLVTLGQWQRDGLTCLATSATQAATDRAAHASPKCSCTSCAASPPWDSRPSTACSSWLRALANSRSTAGLLCGCRAVSRQRRSQASCRAAPIVARGMAAATWLDQLLMTCFTSARIICTKGAK